MASLQPIRGTHDILAEDHRLYRLVMETAYEIAARYGYQEHSTPIFEFTDVFARTLGDTSDIVTKEMYTFADRNGESLTLRPEYTAGICRMFISNGMTQQLPLKVFCRGPMFRYERPQKGRQRQFHQIDAEILGVADPLADIEVIALGAHILEALGLMDQVKLELNTLGDSESRAAYRKRLVEYFNDFRGKLSEESLIRLGKNPLRILDSKDKGDRVIVKGAPLMSETLNALSEDFFGQVKQGLESVGVAYHIEPHLVRGMDYYCHTAFEFTTDTLGAQGAVLAGGRYDGLIETMGGPRTPGIGWAAGVERLSMMVGDAPEAPRPIVVIPVGADQASKALIITQRLRKAGLNVNLGFSGNVKKRLNRANKVNAVAALLIGEDELAKGVATLRDMETGEQYEAPLSSLEEHLARYR
ncbi:MAG: histidine--tRNA ligase [Rhodospirillales bacterium]|jgi:histidyl-tRNA synthetase|tara:strand:- start:1313 stop:2557 length:1245 start_codon:yes stop_codon:yes gene_type:complete